MTAAIVPAATPTNRTHNQPDQASWMPDTRAHIESLFFLVKFLKLNQTL